MLNNGYSTDIFVLILAIISACILIIAYKLRKGIEWAWDGAIIISIMHIIIIVTMAIFLNNLNSTSYIVLDFLFIYYLYRPHVKSYFNIGEVTAFDTQKWKKDKNKIVTILIILGIILLIMPFLSYFLKDLFFGGNGLLFLIVGILIRGS